MIKIMEMDETVSLRSQMAQDAGPIILINKFTVRPEEADELLRAWASDAAFMKRQPGFIATQLHRGIGGSCTFLNYATWESVQHFRSAFSHPEFQSALVAYPSSTVASPHLFQKVAVPGICVG